MTQKSNTTVTQPTVTPSKSSGYHSSQDPKQLVRIKRTGKLGYIVSGPSETTIFRVRLESPETDWEDREDGKRVGVPIYHRYLFEYEFERVKQTVGAQRK